MKNQPAFQRLAPLMATQWGLVTSAQARRFNVSRSDLYKLERAGKLERLLKGVYRNNSAPSERFEAIHAAWLSLYPQRTAEERLQDSIPDAVVSSHTAAWLLGIGDFVPEPYCFSTPMRKQTQRTGIMLRTKRYPPESLTNREGLPVTTIEQTIADLVAEDTDLSLVSDIFLNASVEMLENLNRPYLAELLAPYAKRNGFPEGDGEKLLLSLLAPLNEKVADSLKTLIETLAPALENMKNAISSQFSSSLMEALQPAMAAITSGVKINIPAEAFQNLQQQLTHTLQRTYPLLNTSHSLENKPRNITTPNHTEEDI